MRHLLNLLPLLTVINIVSGNEVSQYKSYSFVKFGAIYECIWNKIDSFKSEVPYRIEKNEII